MRFLDIAHVDDQVIDADGGDRSIRHFAVSFALS
jgi:hypothetical protein